MGTLDAFETIEQTAKRWGCTGARVRQLASEKKIPGATKIGDVWLVPKTAKRPKAARHAGPGRGHKGPMTGAAVLAARRVVAARKPKRVETRSLQQLSWAAVNRALRGGKLKRATRCQRCKRERLTTAHHHRGYGESYRLDVMWLCRPCHNSVHSHRPRRVRA